MMHKMTNHEPTFSILILEDSATDAELLQFELQEAGFAFTAEVVVNEKEYVHELRESSPDLILSDYDLPGYNGALALAEAKRMCPDTPFILVTGAVGEDRAIEILTQGAKDYVLKNRLQRLAPAVRRAIAEREEYRTRKQVEAALVNANSLLESKVKLRTAELEAEIEERKKMGAALRKSEQRVRLKLESVLSPKGDLGNLELADIIDVQAIQSLMDSFYKLVQIPMAIIDLKGNVLVGVGWQEICLNFHRVHPETAKRCIESDTQLTAGISSGKMRLYKCGNNMWDIATPLMVAGRHVGNIFSGQFFFDDEPLSDAFFRSQARQYAFDEDAYMAALGRVPRFSREHLDAGMTFFIKFADMISKLSYSNIKLAQLLAGQRSGAA
jgi:CheY-like chemotaxis protein/ligand-binding sensor protein